MIFQPRAKIQDTRDRNWEKWNIVGHECTSGLRVWSGKL